MSANYHKAWFENVINETLKCSKYMKVYEDDKNVMYKKLEKYTYGVDGVKENKDFNSPNAVKICGTNIPYENLLVVEK